MHAYIKTCLVVFLLSPVLSLHCHADLEEAPSYAQPTETGTGLNTGYILGQSYEAIYEHLSQRLHEWIGEDYYVDAAPFAVLIMSLLTQRVYRQRAQLYWNAYLRQQRPIGDSLAAAAA